MSIFARHFMLNIFKFFDMNSDKSKVWAKFTSGEYYDAILKRDADSASIAYYLIDKQLRRKLRTLFTTLGCENYFEFQDTIEDFFLYLHDGSKWIYNEPFNVLESIDNKDSLFKWVAVTYRNLLLRKLHDEVKVKLVCEHDNCDEPECHDEKKIRNLSTAIAYADQKYLSRSRFVMYRLLLTFLNKNLAIPQEEMAQAVDMQPVAYRVSTKRVKDHILAYVKCQEQGKKLELDVEHKQMRDTIATNFDSLYSTLSDYYDNAINQLPTADAVKKLRLGYSHNNNYVFHEKFASYGLCNCKNVSYLYDMLISFLKN